MSSESERELLEVLGIELARRGLQLGVLPKPRVVPKRKKAIEGEQMSLVLPVRDFLRERPYQHLHAPLLVMLRSTERMAVGSYRRFGFRRQRAPTADAAAPGAEERAN